MRTRIVAAIGFAIVGCNSSGPDPELLALLDAPHPVEPVAEVSLAVTSDRPLCSPANGCKNCDIDVQVGHTIFVHGYDDDEGAFGRFYSGHFDDKDTTGFKDQNECAGYETFRVNIGQVPSTSPYMCGGRDPRSGACTFWLYAYNEATCTPGTVHEPCVGVCTSRYPDGKCSAWNEEDREWTGTCPASGKCITYAGATRNISYWGKDLSYFIRNNMDSTVVNGSPVRGAHYIPDKTLTLVTHSTGAPAMALMMQKGYDHEAPYEIGAKKVKRVINIQAALGGSCFACSSFAPSNGAIKDLCRLSKKEITFDFGKATFDGTVPWLHISSQGTSSTNCTGGTKAGFEQAFWCDGGHDGVVEVYGHTTSAKHTNGNGTPDTTNPYNVTVRTKEYGYCHIDDTHPSYRKQESRFRLVLGRDRVPIEAVYNYFEHKMLPPPYFPVLFGT
jgi:hypothetical protein